MKRILNSSLALAGLFLSVNSFGQNSTTGQILPSATPCDRVVESFVTDPAARGYSYSGFAYVGTMASGEVLRVQYVNASSDYVVETPLFYITSGGTLTAGFTLRTGTGSNNYFKSSNTLALTVQVVDASDVVVGSYDFSLASAASYCLQLQDADFVSGSMLRYRFIFSSSSSTTMQPTLEFDDFRASSSQQAVLPVTFLSFTATKGVSSNLLTWKVSSEYNVARYEVERSSNGKSWVKYGQVTASVLSIYTFTDVAPMTGSNYYRVKAVDVDGKYKYTAVVAIKSTSKRETVILNAYPSPATSTITIQHDANDEATPLQITSVDGRLVQSVIPSRNSQQTQVNVSRFSPGLYFIRYQNSIGEVETLKFVKQ
jgi:hypothetical protein